MIWYGNDKKKVSMFLQAKHSAGDDDDVNWNTDDEIDNFQSSPVNYISKVSIQPCFWILKKKTPLKNIFMFVFVYDIRET